LQIEVKHVTRAATLAFDKVFQPIVESYYFVGLRKSVHLTRVVTTNSRPDERSGFNAHNLWKNSSKGSKRQDTTPRWPLIDSLDDERLISISRIDSYIN